MSKLWTFILLIPLSCLSQEIIHEEFEIYNDSIFLPGTLSLPNTAQAIPLAIFIHGSGNIDRNGNQGKLIKANYIKMLRDSLNNRGIAFYSYDKRTATVSNHAFLEGVKIEHFAEDANLAVSTFMEDKRFSSIHLIGHSQGSLVGMLVRSPAIKSFISLAGSGSTIDQILISQISNQNKDFGQIAKEHIEQLMETDTIREVNPFLNSIFNAKNQKFLKGWITLDPSKAIHELKVPVLIINGDADTQVPVEEAKKLHEARQSSKLVIVPKMNHVLKKVNSPGENQQSYYIPDFQLPTSLISVISEFILSHG